MHKKHPGIIVIAFGGVSVRSVTKLCLSCLFVEVSKQNRTLTVAAVRSALPPVVRAIHMGIRVHHPGARRNLSAW